MDLRDRPTSQKEIDLNQSLIEKRFKLWIHAPSQRFSLINKNSDWVLFLYCTGTQNIFILYLHLYRFTVQFFAEYENARNQITTIIIVDKIYIRRNSKSR